MFDLDPIGAMFIIIAVLWLIAAVAYGLFNLKRAVVISLS